jgi:hypothetical protein
MSGHQALSIAAAGFADKLCIASRADVPTISMDRRYRAL